MQALKKVASITKDQTKDVSSMVVKLPAQAGENPKVFFRFLTEGQDHIGMKATTNKDVWYKSDLPMVKTTDGSDAVLLVDSHLQQLQPGDSLDIAYQPPEPKDTTTPKK